MQQHQQRAFADAATDDAHVHFSQQQSHAHTFAIRACSDKVAATDDRGTVNNLHTHHVRKKKSIKIDMKHGEVDISSRETAICIGNSFSSSFTFLLSLSINALFYSGRFPFLFFLYTYFFNVIEFHQ